MELSSAVIVSRMHRRDDGGVSMAWGAKYAPERATVVVNGSGLLCFKDVKRITEEAARLINETRSSRLLLDCSDADLDVGIVDVFRVPECYDKAGMPRSVRIALILPKTQQPYDLYEFYETVCRNKGYLCRLFGSHQSAEQWLQREAHPRQPHSPPVPWPQHSG